MARTKFYLLLIALAAIGLYALTQWSLLPLPSSVQTVGELSRPKLLDRNGTPLLVTYQNKLNLTDAVSLHDLPLFLKQAFIFSEDKRFYSHNGIDWSARLAALWQNLVSLRQKRGASTISEQVVRILHPRPRTVWSRWLEGWEAKILEGRFSKGEILEFYLNQVPYSGNRRGVQQASNYFFGRDLSTLSKKEMLALVTMVRAPNRLDPTKNPSEIEAAIGSLSDRLAKAGELSLEDSAAVKAEGLSVTASKLPLSADHFVRFALTNLHSSSSNVLTTLDGSLQSRVEELLSSRLKDLQRRRVNSGAVLVADHTNGEILAWVNAKSSASELRESQIDAVLTPRQPGSTLKPFLYALALSKGWTAATMIDDSPITHKVGRGLHLYRNYSRVNYGPVRLREALGNSLNIPAIRTAMFTGKSEFLDFLHKFGFQSLRKHPDFYGEGLALGNGEVSLLELVQAYAALAEKGMWRPFSFQFDQPSAPAKVLSPEISSIISDILTDPDARALEFGEGELLRLPVETAIKTGTSTDYTDAWSIGYDSRYTVGVWLGNLDRKPMSEVSGASGAALILRAVFAELNRAGETKSIFRSPNLSQTQICAKTGKIATKQCPVVHEWFIQGTEPVEVCALHSAELNSQNKIGTERAPHIVLPTPGLEIALDPRIPDRFERLALKLDTEDQGVSWIMDGKVLTDLEDQHLWQPTRGEHTLFAKINRGDQVLTTEVVKFRVR